MTVVQRHRVQQADGQAGLGQVAPGPTLPAQRRSFARPDSGADAGAESAAERMLQLLDELALADAGRLAALAERGRSVSAPAFRGRCLEPTYLAAVASGEWTADDELLLASVLQRAEASCLARVSWRHRRGLRSALRATSVCLLTERLRSAAWQQRRADLASAWTSTIGPLPVA